MIVVAWSALYLSPAGAAPVDAASDHAATVAYGQYLSAVVSRIPALRSADDAFISSVTMSCPNVLAPINLLPTRSVNKGAVLAFGEELGSDVLVAALGAERGAVGKLARSLAHLPWSSSQTSKTTKRYAASLRKLVHLMPSDICGDAQALASSNAQVTPRGTLRWLATFSRDVTAKTRGLAAFIKVLESYETSADQSLIKTNNRLVNRLNAATKSLAITEVPKLVSALGLSL
ncbi:MAG: hypothetical protein ACTHMY_07285 [Solirubrobacteraceae bacterium]